MYNISHVFTHFYYIFKNDAHTWSICDYRHQIKNVPFIFVLSTFQKWPPNDPQMDENVADTSFIQSLHQGHHKRRFNSIKFRKTNWQIFPVSAQNGLFLKMINSLSSWTFCMEGIPNMKNTEPLNYTDCFLTKSNGNFQVFLISFLFVFPIIVLCRLFIQRQRSSVYIALHYIGLIHLVQTSFR